MKEVDFKIIQALITKELDSLNIKYIVIFVAVNLIVALINWLIQKNIKNLESRIYKTKVREDRRITIIEEIYKECVAFTYILGKNEMVLELNKISALEKKLSENRLYINSNMNKKITTYLDYLKSLISDFRYKNFEKETKLLKEIEIEFNK
jgi:hypothetical protein